MKKPTTQAHSSTAYLSYVVGFVLSILTTLLAYYIIVNELWTKITLVYVVLAIAVVQLIVQVIFFLHIGRGTHWKLVTFVFTIVVVAILVVGSIWIMDHLNYNMMHMTPVEQQQYMHDNQGI